MIGAVEIVRLRKMLDARLLMVTGEEVVGVVAETGINVSCHG
jgi:hypothetical protein